MKYFVQPPMKAGDYVGLTLAGGRKIKRAMVTSVSPGTQWPPHIVVRAVTNDPAAIEILTTVSGGKDAIVEFDVPEQQL